MRMRLAANTQLGDWNNASSPLPSDQTYDVTPSGGNTAFKLQAPVYLPRLRR